MMAVRFTGKFAKSLFEKTGERSINNLWSGYGLSAKGKKVAWMGLGAYAGYEALKGAYRYNYDTTLVYNMDDRGVQSLPATQADGLGYMVPGYENPQGVSVPKLDMTLGASGDLVFALHNLRHGGR
jgi:hypothetical protein